MNQIEKKIYRNFAATIVLRAINDWNTHREDVCSFFQSKWGEYLCSVFNVTGKDMLDGLENGTIKPEVFKEDYLYEEIIIHN